MNQSRQLYLEWEDTGGRSCLKIQGWTGTEIRELDGLAAGGFSRRLALLTGEVLQSGDDWRVLPSVAGEFALETDTLCFVPRFPFVDGMDYSLATFTGSNDEAPEFWTIHRPSGALSPATEVVAVYPTASELPVNLLKIYVHFSGPMSEGWAHRAVKVVREDTGDALEAVFLPPDPELWDSERRRLTMLLDPGRIKRGLVPNLEDGYPLIEGVPILVTVDHQFRDASGQPLKAGGQRSYQIGPALRSRIDPELWRLSAPECGSLNSLAVEFDRPLDHALLQHSLHVRDPVGALVDGEQQVGIKECSWRFTPSLPWAKGAHQLVIQPNLEDVSGNSPIRVFDRDITKFDESPTENGPKSLSFLPFLSGKGPSSIKGSLQP